jgi:uncharacterized LabA/DUF88 family protein
MYQKLREYGYSLTFKPVLVNRAGLVKGNVDADLVLLVMRDYKNNKFDRAMIVTSDGDFYCLIEYLYQKHKLLIVMSPNHRKCSVLLRIKAREKLIFMENLRDKLSYKRKSTA